MAISKGLKTTLNQIRDLSTDLYQREVPAITDDMAIATWGTPILDIKEVQNEFISSLINRIVYTQFTIKYFRNPLQVLEGDRLPLGAMGQEIYVNPQKGRKFNGDDFAGLLVKYEADVKAQYTSINSDLQYPITILRQDLKKAFVSWDNLETFIDQLSNSLYMGAYIDEYKLTKGLISGAYKGNNAVIQKIDSPNTEELAKAFITQARGMFLNFQVPSSSYNAWQKMGGYGRPIQTWTNPEDVVFIIRNDLRAYLDVNVLASAFNIDRTTLLGNIISVDNFDMYDEDDNKIFDGSNIIGFMGDKSWFRIKKQDMFMDTFYNPNNRTWQYYLNIIKMYNYSLFANGVIFATELPVGVNITDITTTVTELKEGQNYVPLTITSPNYTGTIDVKVNDDNVDKVVAQMQGTNTLDVVVSSDTVSPIEIVLTIGNFSKTLSFTYQAPTTANVRKTRKA